MDKEYLLGLLALTVSILFIILVISIDFADAYDFALDINNYEYLEPTLFYEQHSIDESGDGNYFVFFNPNNYTVKFDSINVTTTQNGPWTHIASPHSFNHVLNTTIREHEISVNNVHIANRSSFQHIMYGNIVLFDHQRLQIEALQDQITRLNSTILELEYDISKLQKQK